MGAVRKIFDGLFALLRANPIGIVFTGISLAIAHWETLSKWIKEAYNWTKDVLGLSLSSKLEEAEEKAASLRKQIDSANNSVVGKILYHQHYWGVGRRIIGSG